ncbi:MAG: hypothetical protein ACUVTR_01465 [Dehalococcoidia bacterium]
MVKSYLLMPAGVIFVLLHKGIAATARAFWRQATRGRHSPQKLTASGIGSSKQPPFQSSVALRALTIVGSGHKGWAGSLACLITCLVGGITPDITGRVALWMVGVGAVRATTVSSPWRWQR